VPRGEHKVEGFGVRRDRLDDTARSALGDNVDGDASPGGARRSRASTVGGLGVTVVATSAMGYVLLLLAGKHLSAVENAVFLGFWGLLMGVGSALSPVEQELSRQTAVAAARGHRPDSSVARTFAVTQTVAIVVAAVLAVPAVHARLFDQHRELALVAGCGIVAFPALYAMRGLFIGAGQSGRYSAILLAEAAARLVLFVGFVVAGVGGLTWLAVAVAVGSCAWLPFTFRARGLVEPSPSSEPWGALWRRMLGLMVSAALTASVLTGYPAVVKLVAPRGSEDVLGGLFLAVSLLRSPLLLVLAPIQTLAVPTVVRVLHQPDGARRLKRFAAAGAGGTLVLGLVAGVGAYVAGPWVFHLLYKDKFTVSAWTMAGLGWSGIALAATMLTVAVLVARKQTGRVVTVWAVVAGLSLLLLLLSPGGIMFRAVLGATVAPTIGLAVALALAVATRDDAARNE
jgi:O-antigen/teichoic acid export membrane protein